ncbi:MAG TPA: hypothetical protein VHF22_02300 [Planctomycetota bacterium]|nr:hypothetical protein [Planctomycetota bacterium]
MRRMPSLRLAAGLALAAALGAPLARAGDGPAVPTAPAAPRTAETPNGALSFAVPDGWAAKPLKAGVALEPPGNPIEETIFVACEPWAAPKDGKEHDPYAEVLERLKAGQLATVEASPRPTREPFTSVSGPGIEVTYKGTDDGGRPAALAIFLLPCDGRMAILTARIPWKRVAERWKALNDVCGSFRPLPAGEERALAARLAGTWRSDAAPLVALKFLPDGTFEEQREAGKTLPVASRPSQTKAGSFEVIGREVRLRFDDGETRAFRVDGWQAGQFTSAGQTWTRIGD